MSERAACQQPGAWPKTVRDSLACLDAIEWVQGRHHGWRFTRDVEFVGPVVVTIWRGRSYNVSVSAGDAAPRRYRWSDDEQMAEWLFLWQ